MAAGLKAIIRVKLACLLIGGAAMLPLASRCIDGRRLECPELMLPTLGVTCN